MFCTLLYCTHIQKFNNTTIKASIRLHYQKSGLTGNFQRMEDFMTKKLFLGLVVCLWMLIGTNAWALQSWDYVYSVSEGEVTIEQYTGSGGDVVIPDTIDGYPVVGITGYWVFDVMFDQYYGAFANCESSEYWEFHRCYELTSVTIPDSITNIGPGAFAYCRSLTSVTIGNSVTSIGYGAFKGCLSLPNIDIPDSVTSIEDSTFSRCRALTSVTIGNSVTNIGYDAFYHCSSLTSVNIPDSVTNIGVGAFKSCLSLPNIDIPDSVTNIGSEAFWYCESLINVTIGKNVTSIGRRVFAWCSSLTSVIIPDSVTIIDHAAFEGCASLSVAYFLGDAPTMGNGVFDDTAPDFNICYTAEATGFETPTWGGYPAADCACSFDTDCADNEICVDGVCTLMADAPPAIELGPFLAAGPWPVLPTDPDNPMILTQDYSVLWTVSDDYASCPEFCTHTAEYQAVGESAWTELTVTADPIEEWYAYVDLPIETTLQNATTYALRFTVTDCAGQSTDSGLYYFRIVTVTEDAPPVIESGPFLAAGSWPLLATTESRAFSLSQNYHVLWTFSDDYASCEDGLCTHHARYRKVGEDVWTWLTPVSTDSTDSWYAYVELPVGILENGIYQFRIDTTDCIGQIDFSTIYYFKVAKP